MSYKKQLAPSGIVGPIIFNSFGDATLTLQIPGTNINHRDDDARLDSLDDVAGAIATLPGWYVLQYIPRQVPVSAVAARVAAALRDGQSIDDTPKWEDLMYDDAKWAAGLNDPPVEDLTILTLQLPAGKALAGGGSTRPSRDRIRKARAQANEILRRIRVFLPNAEPCDAGTLSWIYDYAAAFGGMEPPFTLEQYRPNDDADAIGKLVPILGCALNETALERPRGRGAKEELSALIEGWMNITAPLIEDPMCPFPETDEKGRPFPNWQNTFHKNYIVVGARETTLYPEEAMNDKLRTLNFPVRVAAMGDPISDTATLNKLERTFKELEYAISQSSRDTAPPEELEASIRAARALYARVTRDQTAREPLSIVLSIAATTREELDARARILRDTLKGAGIRTICPPGQQTELWAAMLPGARTPEFVKLFARHLLPEGVAALGLHHTDEAGDGIGRVWGTLSNRYPKRLVHRLVTLGPDAREGMAYGGSITGNSGDQGSGKSLDGKNIFYDVCALGGGGATIDVTPEGEWGDAVSAMGVDDVIVEFATKGPVIDPMRVFTRNKPTDDAKNDLGLSRQAAEAQAETHTLGYLAIMLGLDKGSTKYKVLRRAVQLVLSDSTEIEPSMPSLLTLLRHWAKEPGLKTPKLRNGKADPTYTPATAVYITQAEDLVLDLSGIAESGDVGEQLFGDGKVLDLTTQVIVFAAPDMKMSDPASRAYIYLATAYCLRFMSATDRPNMIAFTELKALTKDEFGADLVDLVYRQSRRRYAIVFVDSQLARDFTDGEQINQRTVARTRNEANAVQALQWLGINNPDKDLIKWVRSMDPKRGQKVYRDQRDRIALVDVLKPHNPLRYEAARTDHDRQPQKERTI